MAEIEIDKQKQIDFASSKHAQTAVKILKDCCSFFDRLIDEENAHRTVVNIATFEAEQLMHARFIESLENIKKGKFNVK